MSLNPVFSLLGRRLRLAVIGGGPGSFIGANCRGPEKVRRLQEVFGPNVHLAAAYGDTAGDHEMLQIADEKGYRIFAGRP